MSVISRNRRQVQKDETRGVILGAARDLIGAAGYDSMSTRAVAERAGVAVGTVFLHFPDKTALIEALLHDHIESALEGALASLPSGDLAAKLVHVAAHLYQAYDANPQLARVYLRENLFFAGGGERPLAAQLGRFEAWASEQCAAAVHKGEIAVIEPRLAFAAFFSFYLALLLSGLRGEITPPQRLSILDGLLRQHFHIQEKP